MPILVCSSEYLQGILLLRKTSHISLTHLTIGEHLHIFQVLAFVTCSAIDIHVQVLV